MNETWQVLRHCCVGRKWWDQNKFMTKRVLTGKETQLKKSCRGSKGPSQVHMRQ